MTSHANHRPLKAAVIGTGKISEEHLKFLSASDRAEVVGVCDLSPSMGELARKRFGATHAFTDYKQMLAEVGPDVIHVLTPPHTHVQLVGDGLDSGAHVIVEKPVAPTHDEFELLWKQARSCERHLIEDHNYRFNRPVRRIEELVAKGKLGEVREVDVRMALGIREGGRYADTNLPHPSHELPAGILHEFVTHLAYLALRFLPAVDRVTAAWSNHGGGELFKYDDLDALVIGGEVHGRIRFSSGTWPESFTITVRGTKGSAHTDLFHPHLVYSHPRAVGSQLSPVADQVARGAGLIKSGVAGFWNKIRGITPYEGLHRFLGETYRALGEKSEPPVRYDDMARASLLIQDLLAEANRI